MIRIFIVKLFFKLLLAGVCTLLPFIALFAQVTMQFTPSINGLSVAGLFTVQVYNANAFAYHAKIKITVQDGNNKTVLIATTPALLIKPGINAIQSLAAQSLLRFGNSPFAHIAAQTGRFAESDYEYCFEFNGAENKQGADERVYENCFRYAIPAILPLNLVYPGEGDAICNTRPGFTWQPAVPSVNSRRYRLIVAEKKQGQTDGDAIINNTPVLMQDNIIAYAQSYPAQMPDLQKGKKYAWQVVAFEENIQVTQSEIWDFSIDCDDKKPDSTKESYRQLSPILNGNYYISTGILKFSILNPYGPVNMQYAITDIADPSKKISNLPFVKVQTGLNKIDLDLADIKGLEANKMYHLKINNTGDHVLYLQFIYKGNAD